MPTPIAVLLAATVADVASAPPMGWRSWNCFKLDVSQLRMLKQADALNNSGLLASGFSEIGVDDGWQACGSVVNGSFHDAAGKPLVNKTLFPDLKGMVATAKSKGVRMGWYVTVASCPSKQTSPPTRVMGVRLDQHLPEQTIP